MDLNFNEYKFNIFKAEDEVSEEISEQEIFDGRLDYIHLYGKPVSILNFRIAGKFIIDNSTLDEIFQYPEVKDRKIVAVSIIGAFRKGKSFLMDYALRYMYGNVSIEDYCKL